MKSKILAVAAVSAAVFSIGGFSVCNTANAEETCACAASKDPVVGNWGLKLPYDGMYAGHMIVKRDKSGKPEALMLFRWGSPAKVKDVKINGSKFTIKHPWGYTLEGEAGEKTLEGKMTETKSGKLVGAIKGWRNKPPAPAKALKKAKFGEPIDLLADGLDGWVSMNPKAKFGWKFKDGVLSNALGRKPDGKWAGGGANIKTKRADFKDFQLEYDVRVPEKSNSGLYLRGRYEIQVYDSYGSKPSKEGMCALYGRIAPKVSAEKPAGEWQHVKVVLYKGRVSVELNGKTIIDNKPVGGVTGGAIDANEDVPGPIYLQGDHSDADFKNMILRPALN